MGEVFLLSCDRLDGAAIREFLGGGEDAAAFGRLVFGLSGFSRACELELARQSAEDRDMIFRTKEMRGDFAVDIPEGAKGFSALVRAFAELPDTGEHSGLIEARLRLNAEDIVRFTKAWLEAGRELGRAREELRFLEPLGTRFRGILSLSEASLRGFLERNGQSFRPPEIRNMAMRMRQLAESGKIWDGDRKKAAAKDANLFRTRKRGVFEYRESFPDSHYFPEGSFLIPPMGREFEDRLVALVREFGGAPDVDGAPCL